MKTLCVAVCLLLAVSAATAGRRALTRPFLKQRPDGWIDERILGGDDVKKGLYPHVVALFDATSGSFLCSGAVVSDTVVLTTAQCVDGKRGDIEVRGGILELTDAAAARETSKYEKRVIHPFFDMEFLDNDIAIVKLESQLILPVVSNGVTIVDKAELPSYAQAAKDWTGESVDIVGWGFVDSSKPEYSPKLKYLQTSIKANAECEKVHGSKVISTKLCAVPDKISTCRGDTGGVITHEKYRKLWLVGLVSFGQPEKCEDDKPLVMTRISSFLEFIEENTDIKVLDNSGSEDL